jgi:outer membrane receptor for ferrienterochelin and colicins
MIHSTKLIRIMQKAIVLLAALLVMGIANAQNILYVKVKDQTTQMPLAGVTVRISKNGATTNAVGLAVLKNIPEGWHIVTYSHVGYKNTMDSLVFPRSTADTLEIMLEPEEAELDEVIIQSTRTGRTIKNTSTRVETIDGEELDEKNNMRPANISMLLHESTGIQVQQTSATSATAAIRVQGLDGRYTQLLKDGYPNFGNFASGLSILEIPPLDLKQVEVIKGPASTLYGGGAIAGVVNFISKLPKEKMEGDFIFNQSNIGQTNIGGHISHKKGKWGYTLLSLVNLQRPYDVDRDDFSELPQNNSFTIHPRLFYYPNASTTLMMGNSFTQGNIRGGDMQVIDGKPDAYHTYLETNRTLRNTATLEWEKKLANRRSMKLKQSLTIFGRTITVPGFGFSGLNTNSFTEGSFVFRQQRHNMVAGFNLIFDRFKQADINTHDARSFTAGAYLQDTWDVTDKVTVESGLRVDNVHYRGSQYRQSQTFVLPRVAALFKISDKITSRLGGGWGYKVPTIFTEQAEARQYQNIRSLTNVRAEQSVGGTFDLNYKTRLGERLSMRVNQLFFYTRINRSLVLQPDAGGNLFFANAAQPTVSKGFETNLQLIYQKDWKLLVGYTFTDARAKYLTGNQFLPLVPRHKLNLTMMYEKEDNFKLGLEGYFTDRQYLNDGRRTPSYWEWGFMAQKTFGKWSFFVNFENFNDQRQSRYKTVANPPHQNPTFDDIWNHTEGFVMNGGIKLKL